MATRVAGLIGFLWSWWVLQERAHVQAMHLRDLQVIGEVGGGDMQ